MLHLSWSGSRHTWLTMRELFVLGDSISLAYGPQLERLVGDRFRFVRKTGMETALADLDDPNGANGGDSAAVRTYIEQRVTAGGFGPDVMLLNCGLHDIKCKPTSRICQIAIEDYRRNLEESLALLNPVVGTLIWVRITPIYETLHNQVKSGIPRYLDDVYGYNVCADAVMEAAGVRIIDLHAFSARAGTDVLYDGVHFIECHAAEQAACIDGHLRAWDL